MIIIRDGKEYELTPQELSEAYCEKMDEITENEKVAIKETIQIELYMYVNKEEADQLINNEKFLDEATDFIYCNVYRYGVDFEHAIQFAFEEIPHKYLDDERDDVGDLHML